jgi:uncharacterized membrane protein
MTRKSKDKSPSILKYFGGKFRRALIAGILVITPLAVSLWILYNLFVKADNLLGVLITRLLGRQVPGLGILLLFFLTLSIGVFARNYVGKKLINWGNLILFRIPLFNKIYIALKQIFEVFLGERKTIFQRVVLFQYPRKGIYSIGFVTSDSEGEVQMKTEQKLVNVFLPTTPNPTSGFLLFIPEEDLIPLDMGIEEGIKLVISGGAVAPDYIGRELQSGEGQISTDNGKIYVSEVDGESTEG